MLRHSPCIQTQHPIRSPESVGVIPEHRARNSALSTTRVVPKQKNKSPWAAGFTKAVGADRFEMRQQEFRGWVCCPFVGEAVLAVPRRPGGTRAHTQGSAFQACAPAPRRGLNLEVRDKL